MLQEAFKTMASFKSPRSPIRKEVHNFIFAAERLLSPTVGDPELTPEECHLICEYLTTMTRDNHPWSSHFASTMSGQAASTMKRGQPTRPEKR